MRKRNITAEDARAISVLALGAPAIGRLAIGRDESADWKSTT
ncbi:MAG TPA: hypothetical protein VMO75_07975 [Chthoniobacterales bacterium]|nr:hypothetical protein [Chthoniobacterales bacterium]